MITDIRNTILRRAALVFTVFAFIVTIGPFALLGAVFRWVESECEVNLRDV
jgi:hypothetical protein